MEDKYIVLELNRAEDSYEQLTYPLNRKSADSYLDKVCIKPGKSYMLAVVIEYRHNKQPYHLTEA